MLHEGKRFGISVLSEDQEALSDRFAGRRGRDRPRGDLRRWSARRRSSTARSRTWSRGWSRSYWGGDHSLFLGRVEYARYGEGNPLLFHGGHYEVLSSPEGSILGALARERVERLLGGGRGARVLRPGEHVLRQGEPGDDAFVILDGQRRVVRDGRDVDPLGAGEFFGEVADAGRAARAPPTWSPTARSGCIALSRETRRRALRSEPELAWRVLEVLAARIRGS